MVALLRGGKGDGAHLRLPGAGADLRLLDAVVAGVPDHVDHRVGERVHQVLVEVGVLAHHLELDVLVELSREIAHNPREAAEDLLHRLHSGLHDRALQIRGYDVKVRYSLVHLRI